MYFRVDKSRLRVRKEKETQAYNCKQKLFNTSLKSNSLAKSLWICKKMVEALFIQSLFDDGRLFYTLKQARETVNKQLI